MFAEKIGQIIGRKPEHEKKEFTPEGVRLLVDEVLKKINIDELKNNDKKVVEDFIEKLIKKFDFDALGENDADSVQQEIMKYMEKKLAIKRYKKMEPTLAFDSINMGLSKRKEII
jgi:uncharacterized protein YpuA (DUF1002 family)